MRVATAQRREEEMLRERRRSAFNDMVSSSDSTMFTSPRMEVGELSRRLSHSSSPLETPRVRSLTSKHDGPTGTTDHPRDLPARVQPPFGTNATNELIIRRQQKANRGIPLRVFGIGNNAMGGGLTQSSRLIHPASPFMMAVLIISAVFQVYSAMVSSFMVGFLWEADLCVLQPPTLYFDLLVDSFFLIEILLNFGTGVHIMGRYGRGEGPFLQTKSFRPPDSSKGIHARLHQHKNTHTRHTHTHTRIDKPC